MADGDLPGDQQQVGKLKRESNDIAKSYEPTPEELAARLKSTETKRFVSPSLDWNTDMQHGYSSMDTCGVANAGCTPRIVFLIRIRSSSTEPSIFGGNDCHCISEEKRVQAKIDPDEAVRN
jgi:hypothetical protein